MAGIHSGPDGAFSLALSGGYEDDIDLGECFTYTGEGAVSSARYFCSSRMTSECLYNSQYS